MLQACGYDIERRQVQLLTTLGDSATLEMPDRMARSVRDDRVVVYLDQNQWSLISASIYRPESIRNASDRAAAHTLISLVQRGFVILPMSFAHVSETCQWDAPQKRYQLALTLAQLSRGWQLRDPLHVRQLEIRESFARSVSAECVLPIDAITLAPNAICSGREPRLAEFPEILNVSADTEQDLAYLRAACATFDTLLDSKAETRAISAGWVQRNEEFQKWLRDNMRQAQQKSKATRAFFLVDTSGELARAAINAGVPREQVLTWLSKRANVEIPKMPTLGLYGEALRDKITNLKATWEENDLTDLFYLTCAAGYSDYVVCEKETAGVLRQGAQRLGRHLSVDRSLTQLMTRLKNVGLGADPDDLRPG